MMNRMTLSAERVLQLQALFGEPKSRPEQLMESRSYAHSRELLLIRTAVQEGDVAELERLWPPVEPAVAAVVTTAGMRRAKGAEGAGRAAAATVPAGGRSRNREAVPGFRGPHRVLLAGGTRWRGRGVGSMTTTGRPGPSRRDSSGAPSRSWRAL